MSQSFFFGETIEDVMSAITGLSCPVCNCEDFDRRAKLQHHVLKVHFQYSFLLEIHGQTGKRVRLNYERVRFEHNIRQYDRKAPIVRTMRFDR